MCINRLTVELSNTKLRFHVKISNMFNFFKYISIYDEFVERQRTYKTEVCVKCVLVQVECDDDIQNCSFKIVNFI